MCESVYTTRSSACVVLPSHSGSALAGKQDAVQLVELIFFPFYHSSFPSGLCTDYHSFSLPGV